jgi:hypothetical protein
MKREIDLPWGRPSQPAESFQTDHPVGRMSTSTLRRRGILTEQQVSDQHQGTFHVADSRGFALLREKFPDRRVTHELTKSFLTVLSGLADIKIPRDFKRRGSLLVKWLDDHYDALKPFVDMIEIQC